MKFDEREADRRHDEAVGQIGRVGRIPEGKQPTGKRTRHLRFQRHRARHDASSRAGTELDSGSQPFPAPTSIAAKALVSHFSRKHLLPECSGAVTSGCVLG
jgi:hypothetical protein